MRSAFFIACLLLSHALISQVTKCEVWQFFGMDSANASIAKTEQYNSRGQLVSETYSDFKSTVQQGVPDGTFQYEYSDTLLLHRYYGAANGDSGRMDYTYEQGKLIRQSYFERKATNSEILSKQPSGVMIMSTGRPDPNAGKWMQTSEVNFTYDRWGRKILYDATRLHWDAQNMYKWEYDEQGHVIKHESYSRGKLTWKEDYQYFDWGYRYWRTWFDFDGNMRHELDPETAGYYPLLFYAIKLDKQGRIVEERITDEKQRLRGRTVNSYDANGRMVRMVYYDAQDKQSVTHKYS